MQQLIFGVEDCIAKKNWVGALFIAVSLPDICGATEGAIKGNGPRYKDWFNRYLKPRYDAETFYDYLMIVSPGAITQLPEAVTSEWKEKKPDVAFTAEDCWSLRNACLHEGIDASRLRKFKLTPPSPNGSLTHMNLIDDVLQLDLVQFCEDVLDGVKKWIADMENQPEISEKIAAMIKVESVIFDGVIGFGSE